MRRSGDQLPRRCRDPEPGALVPNPDDRNFKADVSFRGLVLPGLEQEFRIPYDLDIWPRAPSVFIMDPHETSAEKILGWCVNRRVKHYADLAFIALSAKLDQPGMVSLDDRKLRDTLADKLDSVRALQPSKYADHPSIETLIDDLKRVPAINQKQWADIVYLRGKRDTFNQQLIIRAVREELVPRLERR